MRFSSAAALAVGATLLVTACSGGADEADDLEAAPAADQKGCDDVDLSQPPADPTTIRIGHGAASEEPFWYMSVSDEIGQYDGDWYDQELAPFRGTGERLTAYQAGELDAVVISPQAQITGTSRGALDLYTIATIMREADPDAFSTSFVSLEGSGIEAPEDMEGKRVAIIDEGSHLDFVARQGLRQAGLDPDTDAQFVVFPFPAQEEALRGGQIDLAGLPEPFYTLAMSKGGVQDVYNAADLTDFSYDLLTVSFRQDFVEENLGAVCAWAADYAESMEAYREDPDAVKRALVGTDFVQLPEPVYLSTQDYARPEGGVVDTESTEQMMDTMIEFGILEESDRIDTSQLVRPGVSLGH